jgi:hypothetical protein
MDGGVVAAYVVTSLLGGLGRFADKKLDDLLKPGGRPHRLSRAGRVAAIFLACHCSHIGQSAAGNALYAWELQMNDAGQRFTRRSSSPSWRYREWSAAVL